jgi:hypothetical protein
MPGSDVRYDLSNDASSFVRLKVSTFEYDYTRCMWLRRMLLCFHPFFIVSSRERINYFADNNAHTTPI